jgi:hypothetical protein
MRITGCFLLTLGIARLSLAPPAAASTLNISDTATTGFGSANTQQFNSSPTASTILTGLRGHAGLYGSQQLRHSQLFGIRPVRPHFSLFQHLRTLHIQRGDKLRSFYRRVSFCRGSLQRNQQ